jgi:N-sulfoglucosamine sulfohydrolase
MYDFGIHLPLAMSLPAQMKGGRVSDELVSFADFAPTFLELAGVAVGRELVGRSLAPLLRESRSLGRKRVFSGRERHSHARRDNLGYPARAMREGDHLFVWNMKPERWPAGDEAGGYADIDNGPTKSWMMAHREHPLFEHSFGRRPEEQLFDVKSDPGCLRNLAAAQPALRKRMRAALEKELRAQGDARVLGGGDVWESYPRYSPMRKDLGGFAEQGKFNPAFAPK